MVGELSAAVTRVTGPRGMSSSRELAQTFHMSVAKFKRERENTRGLLRSRLGTRTSLLMTLLAKASSKIQGTRNRLYLLMGRAAKSVAKGRDAGRSEKLQTFLQPIYLTLLLQF